LLAELSIFRVIRRLVRMEDQKEKLLLLILLEVVQDSMSTQGTLVQSIVYQVVLQLMRLLWMLPQRKNWYELSCDSA